MTTIEKLRTLARELAGEAWEVMEQADAIQREDAIFEDSPVGDGGVPLGLTHGTRW